MIFVIFFIVVFKKNFWGILKMNFLKNPNTFIKYIFLKIMNLCVKNNVLHKNRVSFSPWAETDISYTPRILIRKYVSIPHTPWLYSE